MPWISSKMYFSEDSEPLRDWYHYSYSCHNAPLPTTHLKITGETPEVRSNKKKPREKKDRKRGRKRENERKWEKKRERKEKKEKKIK